MVGGWYSSGQIIVKKSFPSRFARVTSIRESGIHEVPLTDRLVSGYDPVDETEDYTIIQPVMGGRAV